MDSTAIVLPDAVARPDRVRRHISAWVVPADEWELRAHVPLGLEAPELSVDALVDLAGVAALAGVSAGTARSYVHRGYLPPPVRVFGASPVWSRPVVLRALAQRPGQGRSGDRGRAARSSRRPRRAESGTAEPRTTTPPAEAGGVVQILERVEDRWLEDS